MSKITSFTLVFLQTDVLMSQMIHLCLVVYQEIVYFPQPEPVVAEKELNIRPIPRAGIKQDYYRSAENPHPKERHLVQVRPG